MCEEVGSYQCWVSARRPQSAAVDGSTLDGLDSWPRDPKATSEVLAMGPGFPVTHGLGVPGGKFLRPCETLVDELDEGGGPRVAIKVSSYHALCGPADGVAAGHRIRLSVRCGRHRGQQCHGGRHPRRRQIEFAGEDSYVSIADDGEGMTSNGLIEALRYGSRRSYSPSDLGRYGLGLKTASLSQCRSVTVVSCRRAVREVLTCGRSISTSSPSRTSGLFRACLRRP